MRELEFDVLVVGTGAGGGTVAARLAKHCADGLRLAVLEAGPWFPRETFSMRELEMLRLFKRRAAVTSENMEISVAAGECVGGSTSIYTGVTFRAPEGLVQGWAEAQATPELDEADIQGRFDAIEQSICAHVPDRSLENANNRLFREGCESLGHPVKQFKLNIQDCAECGFCNLGCPTGAKRGTLEVQIPNAIASGAQLFSCTQVDRVGEGYVEARVREAPEGAHDPGLEPGDVRFRAKTIILAGGTMGTPAMLMRSAQTLPALSPTLGRFITLHPALMSFARYEDEVRGYEGFPKLYYTDAFSSSDHFYLETAFYFPFVTAKSLPDFGAEHSRFMRHYGNMTCALTLVHDEAEEENRIALKGEDIGLHYRLSPRSRQALVEAQRRAGEIFFASGAEEYVTPISDRFSHTDSSSLATGICDRELQIGRVVASSAHPMGGARIGGSKDEGVVDAWGRVHDCEGLYVADASIFPSSTKVNPYLTIMAMADRIGEHIEAGLGV